MFVCMCLGQHNEQKLTDEVSLVACSTDQLAVLAKLICLFCHEQTEEAAQGYLHSSVSDQHADFI